MVGDCMRVRIQYVVSTDPLVALVIIVKSWYEHEHEHQDQCHDEGHDEGHDIHHSVYRLMQSACCLLRRKTLHDSASPPASDSYDREVGKFYYIIRAMCYHDNTSAPRAL